MQILGLCPKSRCFWGSNHELLLFSALQQAVQMLNVTFLKIYLGLCSLQKKKRKKLLALVTIFVIKGIFVGFNNIFLWHEWEDISKKKKNAYFLNFSKIKLYILKLRLIMCVSLLPPTTVLGKVLCTRLSVKIAIISY